MKLFRIYSKRALAPWHPKCRDAVRHCGSGEASARASGQLQFCACLLISPDLNVALATRLMPAILIKCAPSEVRLQQVHSTDASGPQLLAGSNFFAANFSKCLAPSTELRAPGHCHYVPVELIRYGRHSRIIVGTLFEKLKGKNYVFGGEKHCTSVRIADKWKGWLQ